MKNAGLALAEKPLNCSRMDESRDVNKRRKKSISWLGAGFLVLLCGIVALCFTSFPGKVKRGLKEIFAPKNWVPRFAMGSWN